MQSQSFSNHCRKKKKETSVLGSSSSLSFFFSTILRKKRKLTNCSFLLLVVVSFSLFSPRDEWCELWTLRASRRGGYSTERASSVSWLRQVCIFLGLTDTQCQLPLSFYWQSASITYSASSISSQGKDLLLCILRGCNFPWTWWLHNLKGFWKYTYFAISCIIKFLWIELRFQVSYFVSYFCKTILHWIFDIWPKWFQKSWSCICNSLPEANL